MAKKHKKEFRPKEEIKEKKPIIQLKDYQKDLITFAVVFILLLIVFSPMAFQGMRPGGVDVIGSKGSSHQRIEFEKQTGKTALWNPPVFSGMPIYHRIGGKAFNFDTILNKTFGKILYTYIWLYLIGFIGMFLLLRFLKLGYLSAIFGGLGFIFIPHYMSLLSIGHFAKFRPIMYAPLVTFFFISFLNKKNLLWLIGFIFAFSIQIRTQHYQIIFYQIMILVFVGLYYFIGMLREKRIKEFLIKIILLGASSILIIMMVAQPLFVTGEYTPYSIRGGTGEKGSTGLDMDYATKWSLHPAEMLCFVMPRFFGGISGEIYTGNKVPELKGRQIPGYWGHMPFTQAYEYIGVVLLFMAILGLILNFKNGLIKTLFALFLLSLFLSFGRHFPLLYNLFFTYIPYFNKFRVPAMISVIMQLIIVIWAGFGVSRLLKIQDKDRKKIQQIIIGIAIFMLILGLVPQIFGNSFSFEKAGENENYNHPLYQSARKDMMQSDGWRLILFALLTSGLCLLIVNKKLKPILFMALLVPLLLIDQIPYTLKAEGKLSNIDYLEKRHFRKSSTDKKILQDTTYYRIFPITDNPFNNNDWSYYHNSIGGYNAAKLRIYQDIIENCLYKGTDPQLPINWNILKMLNCKYIISNSQIPYRDLEPYFYNGKKKNPVMVYQYKKVKPAWFVGNYKVISDRKKRFSALNDRNFDAFKTAILEKEIIHNIQSPDSSFVKVKKASFNEMMYEVYNDKPSLLVVSEVYYPKGWKCYVDDKEVEIYKTNHILRSIYIDKAGKHIVHFVFRPETFYKNYYMMEYDMYIHQ